MYGKKLGVRGWHGYIIQAYKCNARGSKYEAGILLWRIYGGQLCPLSVKNGKKNKKESSRTWITNTSLLPLTHGEWSFPCRHACVGLYSYIPPISNEIFASNDVAVEKCVTKLAIL